MTIFKTYDTSPDCLPIYFYVEDVRLVKEAIHSPGCNELCSMVRFYDEREPEYIPRSEGDRLVEIMEVGGAESDQVTISMPRDQILELAKVAEENPQEFYEVTFNTYPIPGAEEGRN